MMQQAPKENKSTPKRVAKAAAEEKMMMQQAP
jgi:hypothetical protein